MTAFEMARHPAHAHPPLIWSREGEAIANPYPAGSCGIRRLGAARGGVVLFGNAAFERLNGFPNAYWGWGPEDLELGMRCDLAGLRFERRDGAYMALHHKHAGFAAPGVYTEEARRTHAVWAQRRDNLAAVAADVIEFKLLEQRRLTLEGKDRPPITHHLIDIGEPR